MGYFTCLFCVLSLWNLIAHLNSIIKERFCFLSFLRRLQDLVCIFPSSAPQFRLHFRGTITPCDLGLPDWRDSSRWRAKQGRDTGAGKPGVSAGNGGRLSACGDVYLKESYGQHCGNIREARLWRAFDARIKCLDFRNRWREATALKVNWEGKKALPWEEVSMKDAGGG